MSAERRDDFRIEALTRPCRSDIEQLAQVLVDCVEGGASVSFMHPLTLERAEAFWRKIAEDAEEGNLVLIAALDATGIVGTVQIILDLPENQPHRAEVAKMLVHRRARRRGIGTALMRAVEVMAKALDKTLLVLDTASGDADRLYLRLGWQLVGAIPDFALWPGGGFCDTRIYYRRLA